MLSHCNSPPLRENVVHVWQQRTESLGDWAFADPLREVLSPSEQTRLAQIRRDADRAIYYVSRLMMRTVLARYLDCSCENIAFGANDYGKPVLKVSDPPSVHFNLTHSRGAVALAVSLNREVGIDIEDRRRTVEYMALAERFFAPSETTHLRGLLGDSVREAFFAIWTLKEAYVKGIGRGLSFPLDAFCFDLDAHRLLAFRPLADFVATDWRFRQFELSDRHCGALAVRGHLDDEVCVEFFDWEDHFRAGILSARTESL